MRYCYTPNLGLFAATTGANGDILIPENKLRAAVALGANGAAVLELERRYDISPAALSFGVRVLAEPAVRASVADLGRQLGRIPAPASRALDFEKERALRLLQGR